MTRASLADSHRPQSAPPPSPSLPSPARRKELPGLPSRALCRWLRWLTPAFVAWFVGLVLLVHWTEVLP